MIVTFDTKYFNYEKITEPLIAVPLSMFKKQFSRTLKTLTKEDISKSYDLAVKEKSNKKLINARDFLKTL